MAINCPADAPHLLWRKGQSKFMPEVGAFFSATKFDDINNWWNGLVWSHIRADDIGKVQS